MLDLRDAMIEADSLRSGRTPAGDNFCRLWESFAGRGMGLSATDTADNGFNRVGAAYDVPDGCVAPPPPPAVTVTATAPTGYEAGQIPAAVAFRRGTPGDRPLLVNYTTAGTAAAGSDYVALTGTAEIPAGAAEVVVPIVPLDDSFVETTEALTVSVSRGSGYTTGTPSSATITIVSDDVAPDLLVSALSAPRTAGSGDTIGVTCTVKNNGSGAAAPSRTHFYLSKNALLDAADAFLGSSAVPELAPGQDSVCSASLVLPSPLDAGSMYLFAKADGPAALAETNELNNTRAAAIAIGPDLVISTLTAPAAGAAGSAMVVTDTTLNQGAGQAGASATRMFLSSNVFLDALDVALEARDVPALAVGASSSGTTTVTIPAGTPAGSYYLFAKADAAGVLGEANETNNARSALVRIGPDLTVSALSVPARAAAGAPLSIGDTTRNAGAGAAAASVTTFYLSANLTLDDGDLRLEPSRTVPALQASGISSGTTSVVIPAVSPGAWYILARGDDGESVAEALETNNVRAAVVQIGPDLNFLGLTAPTTAVSGSSISVSTIVRNSGAAAAGASVVRLYLSANSVLDAGDSELPAYRDVPALAGGATSSGTTVVPIPSGSTGSFYLLVVADADQAVAESSELNNTVARALTVN
jgi:subtilase family serine protease